MPDRTINESNCRTGSVVDQEQIQAASRQDVLNSLSQIERRFRTRIGESLTTVEEHSMPLVEATTPSLETELPGRLPCAGQATDQYVYLGADAIGARIGWPGTPSLSAPSRTTKVPPTRTKRMLSFANIVSVAISLRCNAFVAVMPRGSWVVSGATPAPPIAREGIGGQSINPERQGRSDLRSPDGSGSVW
jgi:hypothetical protein